MMAVTQPSSYNSSNPHQLPSSGTFNFMSNGGVFVHSNPPKPLISASSSTSSTQNTAIRNWVKNGDVDKLENVVLEGQGARLLGLMDSTSDVKVKTFLRSIPGYMAKVDLIHDAVIRGSVRELQTLLDKKKLALARDAVGRGLAHKAVLHSQKNVLDWLGKKYPDAIQIRDNESRSCLHYSGIAKNPTDMYNFLLNLGSNPELVDIHGRKASYYLTNPQDLYIEGVGGGAGPGGFRNKFRGSNNKFNSRGRRISPISPKSSPSPPISTQASLQPVQQHSSAGAISKQTPSTLPPNSSMITRAQIRIWIHEKDISKLEKIVWSGNGDKLLLETTNNPKVRRFLDNVPYLLHHIKLIHTAAIHNDVEGLKEIRSRIEQSATNERGAGGVGVSIAPELFTARDAYGLSPLHKATGLNNRGACEYLLYEFGNSLDLQDNFKRSPLHYGAARVSNEPNSSESIYKFLIRAGADEGILDYKHHDAEYYLTRSSECDSFKFLRNIPDSPRVISSDRVLLGWDRSGVALQNRSPGGFKRKISSGDEFGESVSGPVPGGGEEDVGGGGDPGETSDRPVSSKLARTDNNNDDEEEEQAQEDEAPAPEETTTAQPEPMSEDEPEFEDDIVDVGDGYVADSDEGKYELSEDVVIQGVVEEDNPEEPETGNNEEEGGAAAPAEQQEEEKQDEVEPEPEVAEEPPAEPEAMEEDEPAGVPEGDEPEPAVPEEPESKPEENGGEVEEEEIPPPPPEDQEEEEMGPEEDDSPPNYASVLDEQQQQEEGEEQQLSEQTVDDYIANADMESLVNLVLKGEGQELTTKQSGNPEIQEFLNNVPAYMAKIASIHNASYTGNMRDLQSLLDRKRLAEAQDSVGRGPLHHAVLGGHSQVVRYLINGYPACIDMVDKNGRSALHYSATVPDSGVMYKVLIQGGADPNIKDVEGNTPGVYLRRKDLLSIDQLAAASEVAANSSPKRARGPPIVKAVDSWERPPTPYPPDSSSNNKANTSVIMISKSPPPGDRNEDEEEEDDEEQEVAVSNLSLLNSFYLEVLSKDSESIWSRTWKKLTSGNSGEIANKYVKRYLSPKVFHKVKMRSTPRYASTLLDCIKFYPQFFVVAPDPHAYTSFAEVFIPAITESNFGEHGVVRPTETTHPHMVMQGSVSLLPEYPIVDLPSKFVHQVRVRVSRNVRPFPFIPIMKREELYEMQKIVRGVFQDEPYDWFDLEGMEKDQRDELIESRGVWFPEATKISRFWPKGRGFLCNEAGSVQIWVNAEDHVDVIVQSLYGKLHPVLEVVEGVMDKLSRADSEFHFNSQCGYLTVDPFRCGTGIKITFRVRFPNLMQNRSYLTQRCEDLRLTLKWKQKYRMFGSSTEINPDDWVELENAQTWGVDENHIALQVINSVNELIKDEEEKGRAKDRAITKKKEHGGEEEEAPPVEEPEVKRRNSTLLDMEIPEQVEDVVVQKNGTGNFPAIWSEEGKYLASVLGDALVHGLTLVSQNRPNDPVEYLANFLRTYTKGEGGEGENVTSVILVPGEDMEASAPQEEEENGDVTEPPPSTPVEEASNEVEGGEGAGEETQQQQPEEESALTTEIEDAYDKLEESLEEETNNNAGPFDPEKEELEESQLEENTRDSGEDNENALTNPLASSTRDENGQSVLHFASTRPGGASTILAFLQNPSVNLAWRDGSLRTARDVAIHLNRPENARVIDNWIVTLAQRGEAEVLETLMVDGYDHLADVEDTSGVHIVEVAEAAGNREVALLLRGVPEFRERVERVHRCVRSGDFDGVKSLVGADKRVAYGINPKTGRSALHVAVLSEEVQIVKWIAETVPEAIKKTDNLERTCLHYAMGVDKVEKIVRILVRAGAKRVVKDLRDRQPSWYFINRDEIGELQAEERAILN